MALQSSQVATGETILASHLNNLRQDVVANHTHTTGEGGTIAHSDLSDGVISGTALNHTVINTHVQGTSTDSNPDSPGGDQGVHGLAASSYVCGSLGSQLVIAAGEVTLSSRTANVTFSPAFSTIIAITCTAYGAKTGTDNFPMELYLTSVSASGFTVTSQTTSFESNKVYWIAVGTKT